MADIQKTTGPKDVFVQLLLIAALYMSATQLGVLLFQLVNNAFPDAAMEPYLRMSIDAGIRWAIAILMVTAPVFYAVTWHLRRDFERVPEKLHLRSRHWLTALTLFAAALIAIGDFVAVVYSFLQGELTTRFLLKAFVVFVIVGAVMWYEHWEFRRTIGGRPPTSILALRWGSGLVVLAAVIAGFMVIGSPFTARRSRLDAQRASDLQNIQAQAVDYWQRTRSLPASLDALADSISGYTAPRDPETAQSYEYRTTAALQFELCATFQTDTTTRVGQAPKPAQPYRGPYDASLENWAHGAARTCFSRTIDPARYPTRSPISDTFN